MHAALKRGRYSPYRSNLEGRIHQVRLMGEIFEGGESVSLWLGLNSSLKIYAFKAFPASALRNENGASRTLALAPQNQGKYSTRDLNSAWLLLCGFPYWRRSWIIQEDLLARELILSCGSERIPWRDLKAQLFCPNDIVMKDLRLETNPPLPGGCTL